MSEKIPCQECNTLILPSTAEKNEGLCMPCKNGIRANLERAKEYYQQERELDKTCPFRAFWRDLVVRVHNKDQGFYTLRPEGQNYYAVNCLSGEVYNGGFIQYFDNSSGEHYAFAERGLIQMGASHSLNLLHQAKQAVFGEKPVPIDRDRRLAATDNQDLYSVLDKLDDEFYKDLDDLDAKLESYALDYGLVNNT